jgi:phage shock protein PspC (stress-responsive transcriptional regulator)
MDPTFIRVVFIFVSFVTGFIPGFLFYFICFFIIPDNPINSENKR